ncbi:hypothetical protein [Methanohalophilus sp.]|nr:hypothetical protein [Methanohalophilus sp.]MDK2892279.1 hypothetical protein [Methanohalophilus sp.]
MKIPEQVSKEIEMIGGIDKIIENVLMNNVNLPDLATSRAITSMSRITQN